MGVFIPAGTRTPEGFIYPEDRVFTDSQSWWADSEKPFPQARHLHNGAYFPFMKKVKGQSMDLDVLVKCHFDPGEVTMLRVQLYDQLKPAVQHSLSFRSPDGVTQLVKAPVPFQLANDGDGMWFRLKVPIGNCTNDGRVEFRVTANIPKTPAGVSGGNRTYNTTRWHCLIDNGKLPLKNYSTPDRMGAAGWYTGVGYSNIRVNDLDGVRLMYGGPVAAGQKIRVRGDYTPLFVGVDTKPHTADKGVVLYEGAGGSTWRTVTLPALAPGRHTLYVRTEKTIAAPKGTAAGAWMIPFEVA